MNKRIEEQLNVDLVALDVSVNDWEEAIKEGGQLLVDKKLISVSYIDRMIEAVHEHGPYIVLFPGFALAHAAPGPDVFKTSLSFVKFSEPVKFNHETNDPVKVLATLGTVSADEHMDVLMFLAEKMSDESIVDSLFQAKDNDEFLKILKGEN